MPGRKRTLDPGAEGEYRIPGKRVIPDFGGGRRYRIPAAKG